MFLGKVITVRDTDYGEIKPYLKIRDLRINAGKHKELTLPLLDEKTVQANKLPLQHPLSEDTEMPVEIQVAQEVHQNRLFERKRPYNSSKDKK